MQIGDELDNQVEMLEETDGLVHRHQGRLDRATKSLGRIARGANENKGMTTIVVLIVILVLLIAVFK
jgi:syntaxin 8